MQRRKFILGLGAASASGSALIGSGAFTSVAADRDVAIDVADDSDAFLRLAACTDEDGNPKPNGDYVYQGDDGLFSISLSGDNGNDPPAGSGVNPEALSKFHNVFEICNQGTQSVCVNFGVDDESDVPLIPSNADVPDRYEFGPEDPAVVFYEGDTEEPVFPVEGSDPNDGFELDVGECACFGFNVRAFGFDSGEDIFAGTDLTIIADAEAECGEEVPPEPEPEPDPFYGVDRNNNLVEITPDGDGNVAEEDLANLGSTSGNENYPNGLAYDESNEDWYYAEEDGEVFVLDDLNDVPESGEGLGDGTIAGATYFDDDYVYIPQGTNELRKASVDGSDSDKITDLDEVGEVNLGDLAVAFDSSIEAPVIYGSAVTSNEGAAFFKVELISGHEADHFIISDGDDGADNAALGKQIAFVNGELVATKTVDSPDFRKVDLETGELGDSIGLSEREYTDLAQTEVPNIPTEIE